MSTAGDQAPRPLREAMSPSKNRGKRQPGANSSRNGLQSSKGSSEDRPPERGIKADLDFSMDSSSRGGVKTRAHGLALRPATDRCNAHASRPARRRAGSSRRL